MIKRVIEQMLESRFAKDVATLMSGSVLGQLILLATAPVLGRLYSPSDFGAFGVFLAITGILGVICNLRYELAIVLPDSQDCALNLLVSALLSAAMIGGISGVALVLGAPLVERFFHVSGVNDWVWMVPLTVFATGVSQATSYWFARNRQFRIVSASRLLRAGSTATWQIPVGMISAGPIGLLGGRVLGEVAGAALLALRIWIRDRDRFRLVSWAKVKASAREHMDFPLFSCPQALVAALSHNLPAIGMAYFFNSTEVGLFTMAQRLLLQPIILVGTSLRQVYIQRAGEKHSAGESIRPLFTRATGGLAALAVVPAAILFASGPWLFSVALGSEWATAGVYARWLAPWMLFGFMNPPAVVTLQVLGRQRALLFLEAIQLGLRCVALLAGGLLGSAETCAVLLGVAGVSGNTILILFSFTASGEKRPGGC